MSNTGLTEKRGLSRSSQSDDGQLLDRYPPDPDESAYTALVMRHGPMVLGVCRSILNDSPEVEDAFQATFLVLIRKARLTDARDLLRSTRLSRLR